MRFYSGSIIKSTNLTEEFDYKAFQQFYGETAVPLFLITKQNELHVLTTDQEIEPKAGQTIIALVDERKEA